MNISKCITLFSFLKERVVWGELALKAEKLSVCLCVQANQIPALKIR